MILNTVKQNKQNGIRLIGYAVLIVVGFALAVILTVLITQKDVYREDDNKLAQERLKTLRELQTGEQKILTTAGWIDQKAGIARISVDTAMKLELTELQKKQVVKSNVAVNPPATPQAAVPAATTKPAATPAATTEKKP